MDGEASMPSHAERARTLVASKSSGALSTIALDPPGYPYGSQVVYAPVGASPVFLFSKLAEHTKNLEADPRASLLVVESELAGEEVLARGRVTLVGTCRRVDDRARVEEVFLARHPGARRYAAFADFSFWELAVESARWVGGFGRMSWIDADAWREAEGDPLLDAAPGILAHMNEDHGDACVAFARAFSNLGAATSARMVAVDRYGFDLSVETPQGVQVARVAFPRPVSRAEEVRKALVAMVRDARSRLA
jgi:putative heme iron utilization protein